jgi:hypothetical protein
MPAPLPIRTDRDAGELRRLARRERDGRVSARLLALANALDGLPREDAARLAGMTGQTLGDWVHRYNEEGVEGLRDRPRSGRPCALDESQQAALKALVLRAPSSSETAASSGAPETCARWSSVASASAMPRTACCGCSRASTSRGRRPGRSTPRPIRRRRSGSKTLPGLIEGLAREQTGERVELWFMDEARVGQKGRLTHVWYQKGVRQQGFASTYLFGVVCPERGEGVALVLPELSTAAMNVFLAELGSSCTKLPTRTA